MKKPRTTIVTVAAAMAVAFCLPGLSQDGLNGELDDLLGLGGESEPAAEIVDDAADAPADALAPVADEAEAPAEEAPAADDTADALADALAPVADDAEAPAEEAPAADDAADALADALAPVADDAETPAEKAPAADDAADALADALAPVADDAETPAEEAPAADKLAGDEIDALMAPAEEEATAAEEAPAANEADDGAESLADILNSDDEEETPAAEPESQADSAESQDAEPADAAEAAEPAEEPAAEPESPAGNEESQNAEPADAAEEGDSLLDSLLATPADPVAPATETETAPAAEAEAPATEAAGGDALDEALAPVEAEPEEAEAEPADEPVAETTEAGSVAAPDGDDAGAEGEEAPAAVAASTENDEAAAAISEINLLELMRRKALDEHGKKSLMSAQQEIKNGNYVEAQRLFEEASKFLTHRPENNDLIYAADAGIAEAIYRQAEVLYKRGDLEGGLKLARQAREHNHKKSVDLIEKIQHEIENPPEEKVVSEDKRWHDRGYRKNREQVKAKIKRARQFMITGEFDKARTELELILRDNPYDSDAILLLERVSQRAYDNNSREFRATRASMIDQVRETWTPSYRYAIDVPDLVGEGATSDAIGTPVNKAGKTPEEETEEKMRKITIPEINFKGATISEVIEFFVEASREYDDPQIPPEQRGVNLILKIAQSSTAEAPLEEDSIFAPQTSAGDNGIPPVTYSARYMSLWNGLQYACELSRLKFRLRGNTVMIMPINEADVDMISRTYTVLPAIEERASSMTTSLSQRSTDDQGRVTWETPEDSASSGGVDWKQLFEDMGVKWPNGSSVKYLPSINKMRVFNTPENLIEFEKALQELNVTPRQVEIEARFVEVAQTDLESLGFEWLLTDDWEIAKNKKNPEQHIKIAAGSGTAQANRYLSGGANLGNGINISAVNDAILSVSSVLTNPELGFVLHMLSQQANTDLLSAPKVVTKNNEEAIIKVVREYIYPTDYEIKENDIDGDSDNVQISYPSVEPQEFEMREVGVILQVTPNVSEDGQLIDLQLNPQIISDPEWKDYGFDYPIRMSGENAETLHMAMEQPIFKVRSVSTKISIYNGATVVMGGMITEERNEVNDKIPILGDIPLIGRLFRSTYESSEKRNLLIFVTARMVDPAGRTLKTNASDSGTAASGK